MNKPIEWFAKNPVAANLLMVAIIVAGFAACFMVTMEVFPQIELDAITVSVPYPGATPKEVEDSICRRIDEELSGLEGIKRITSTAAEGVGVVSIELETYADARKVLDDVQTKIDAIDTFPEDAKKPVVKMLEVQPQVISVAVAGDAPERSVKEIAERLRDELLALPDVSSVTISSVRPYEIAIEVSESKLREYRMSFNDVVRAVRSSSLDLPAGSIDAEGGEVLIRTVGQAYRGSEFENIALVNRPDGTRIMLGDVATVRDAFAETDQGARFNDNRAAILRVYRVGKQSAIAVADAVKAQVTKSQESMPPGITLTTWKDDTRVLRSRLETLANNGISGLILVLITLALFLKLRVAIWVAVGIPVSFLGALYMMPVGDVTINVISLFAFILVLGIVVDDAIVVGESIYTFRKKAKDGLDAAIRGAQEVATPVVFAVLTTIVAFVPALFVPGASGKIWRVLPIVVIAALMFSLVESLFVLPAHLSHIPLENKRRWKYSPIAIWGAFQERVSNGLEWFVAHLFQPALRAALNWRYATLALALGVLILSVAFVGGGFVTFVFFPSVEADEVTVNVRMPEGTPIAVTEATLGHIETQALRLQEDLRREFGNEQIVHIVNTLGEQATSARHDFTGTASGSNLGGLQMELAPAEARSLSSDHIMNRLREMVGPIAGAEEIAYSASLRSVGKPINIQLTGRNVDELAEVAGKVRKELAQFEGVFDIADTFEAGKRELKLGIKPNAEAVGLTLADLARQVRQGFYGEEAQSVQRGREEVKVMVRYPVDERTSLGFLESMRIRLPNGVEVPFAFVATVEESIGFSKRTRVDGDSAVNITADLDVTRNSANRVVAVLNDKILPAILVDHPHVKFAFEGEQREQRETLTSLGIGFGLALVAIYVLLAVPLKSYMQPVLIMLAIPFGIIGAIAGHYIVGIDLSMLSVIGIVALAGVVVNDSLVLVDFVNRRRLAGEMPAFEAIIDAAMNRFRPILLTSLTTFAGLSPIMLEKSLQAKFLIPMAVSLAFGVMFSTAITLFVVPAAYLVLQDLFRAPRRVIFEYQSAFGPMLRPLGNPTAPHATLPNEPI